MLLQRGARMGSYEVEALLGTGGMGEVYRAIDSKPGRSVALKILPDDPTKRAVLPQWAGHDGVHIGDQGSAAGKIEKLFSGPYAPGAGGYARANYDVFPDGSFLMLKPAEQQPPLTQIKIVLGWSEEVKRLTSPPAR